MIKNIKVLIVLMLVFVLIGSTYAFAAANTIAENAGGYATDDVSGYAATNVVYDLNDTDPTVLVAIELDVAPIEVGAPAAAFVTIRTAATNAWTACSLSSGSTWRCATTDSIESVIDLEVVASSSTNPADI
jgi:hypothetical protein